MRYILGDRVLVDGRRRATVVMETRVIPKPGWSAVKVSDQSIRYHEWKRGSADVLLPLMLEHGMKPFDRPAKGKRNLAIQVHVGGRHLAGDFDNYLKAVTDLLQDLGLIDNDRYIHTGRIAVRDGDVDFFWARIWRAP